MIVSFIEYIVNLIIYGLEAHVFPLFEGPELAIKLSLVMLAVLVLSLLLTIGLILPMLFHLWRIKN